MKYIKGYKALFEAEQYDVEVGKLLNGLKGKSVSFMWNSKGYQPQVMNTKVVSAEVGDLDEYKLTSFVKTERSKSATAGKTGNKKEVINIDFENGMSLCLIDGKFPTYKKHVHGGNTYDQDGQDKMEEWHWLQNATVPKLIDDTINTVIQKLNMKVNGFVVNDSDIALMKDKIKKHTEKCVPIIKKYLNNPKLTNIDIKTIPFEKYGSMRVEFDQGKITFHVSGTPPEVSVMLGRLDNANELDKTHLSKNIESMYKEMYGGEFKVIVN